ncbi:MAG: hypothetical protein WC592_00295 [Candidatus Omnitrophota bacterium]
MARDEALFCRLGDMHDFLEKQKLGYRAEIECLNRDYILKVSEQDLCKSLIDKHTLETPALHDDKLYALPARDANIDVSGRCDYAISRRESPYYVKGTSITIAIPFEGDGQFFEFSPSVYTSYFPRGVITDNEILLTYNGVNMEPAKVKSEYENDVKIIKEHLRSISNMVKQHNGFIESETKRLVANRKDKILKEHNLVAALGIPIKRREDSPATYTIPTVRRKPKIELPKVGGGVFKPEPTLAETEYEHILKIIHDMALVLERSPRVFIDIKEENLRTHFLVQLNGQYEGKATGETFNFNGKTDILIRDDGGNIFIAECKFWTGDKGFTETIDQLLKYVTWRDTKTAIILFNRNKELSSVLSKIPEIVKSHKCFKRELGNKNETSFKYVFQQPSDLNRELLLTVMVFDVPTEFKS